MKVLFVFRGKSDASSVPFIGEQLASLQQQGVETLSYALPGRGLSTYFTAIPRLRKCIQTTRPDLIHAHYALCGLTALLCFSRKPVVVSMMGSDILGEYTGVNKISVRSRIVMRLALLVQWLAKGVIAKSENIKQKLRFPAKSIVLPNGVDLSRFCPGNREASRQRLGLQPGKQYILSLSNPAHAWKNPGWTREALRHLNNDRVEFLSPYPVGREEVVHYLNAADVFVQTSFMEGSSNVLKEAMACNCPVVATAVGDSAWVTGDTEGCFLTGFSLPQFTKALQQALDFAETRGRTRGRDRILLLGLDQQTIARKLKAYYTEILGNTDTTLLNHK